MTPTGNAVTTRLPSPEEGTWSSPGYRSARTRARWAQVLVGIAAAIYVVWAITRINELSLLDRIIGGSAIESEVASFFIPYQIVRDVYRRLETPTRRGGDGSILAWWLLFIIGVIVLRAAGFAINGATTVDVFRSIEMIAIACCAAAAVGGFLFVRIIGEIESRATERAVSLSLRGPDAVWPAQIEVSPTPASVTTPVSIAPPAAPALGADVAGASAPAGPIAYCLRCGRPRVAGTRFCGGCGMDLGGAPE